MKFKLSQKEPRLGSGHLMKSLETGGYVSDIPGPGQSKVVIYCVYSARQLGCKHALNRRKSQDGT